MEFVKDDGIDAVNRGVGQEPAKHDPRGFDEQRRVTTDPGVNSHLVADLAADASAPQSGNLEGDGPGRQPPRLEEHETAVGCPVGPQVVVDRRRHKHGLAGTGRRGDDHGTPT